MKQHRLNGIFRQFPIFLVIFLAMAAAHGQAAHNDCSPQYRIEWPANHPVWSLCWSIPENSSGIDGSGLELHDVSYKGESVLRRAGIPLLNVNYDPGGCGSYRDWQHGSAPFETDGVVNPPEWHYAEPTIPPRTMCDHVGRDAGTFQGVAAEKKWDQLVLTTQLQAGPYRYTQKWIFHLDGTLDARIAFTSRTDPCNTRPHAHHAYFRLEFDIGGDGKDYAEELLDGLRWRRFRREIVRRNDPIRGGDWKVKSSSVNRGYEIVVPPDNGVADAWAVADLWVLASHPEELDDGGARRGPRGSAVQLDQYLNGEDVDGASLALWIHATDRHEHSSRCHFIGPTLRPVGKW
jgi:hypothetical protein